MDVFRYSTKAMNTELEIFISAKSEIYAKSAAFDLIKDIENIEAQLSMFLDGSAIFAINNLKKGETLKILDMPMEALAASMYAANLSRGAVDICMGEYFLNAKNKAQIKNPSKAKIELDPENFLVRKIEDGKLDLGAIGKGFALELLAQKLVETWGIDCARFSFGGSSQLALNPPENSDAWELTFAGQNADWFKFKNFAVGSSGVAIQGMHILDCRTALAPKNPPFRTWALCDSSTIADAMSTAFMILDKSEIAEICAENKIIAGIQAQDNAPIEWIGKENF